MNKTGLVLLIDLNILQVRNCLIEKLNRITYFLFSIASPIEFQNLGFSICFTSLSVFLLMLLMFYSWIIQTETYGVAEMIQVLLYTSVYTAPLPESLSDYNLDFSVRRSCLRW